MEDRFGICSVAGKRRLDGVVDDVKDFHIGSESRLYDLTASFTSIATCDRRDCS